MKLTSLITAAVAATSTVAGTNWDISSIEKARHKDKTIACRDCLFDSLEASISDMFNQMAGGKNTGTATKKGDGHEVILKFKNTASGQVRKPEGSDLFEIAGFTVLDYNHPYAAQGCMSLKYLEKPQAELSFTINSKDYHFKNIPDACTVPA